MILARYDGETWGTVNTKGAGKVSTKGEIFTLIGRLMVEYGLVVDKEHPLVFNLDHCAWTMERRGEDGEITEGEGLSRGADVC